jgi:hypothetical protein
MLLTEKILEVQFISNNKPLKNTDYEKVKN